MKRLLLLNGPNINLLGNREVNTYGTHTLADIEQNLIHLLKKFDYTLECYQSNHEGKLVDTIQEADGKYDGIILNPAAYTHTSVALRDAIMSINVPVVEVHISNIYNREDFRKTSLIAPVCQGHIVGFGVLGYRLAALAFVEEQNI